MSDILIVDDERDIRELISDILKDEGFSTRLAGNSPFDERPAFGLESLFENFERPKFKQNIEDGHSGQEEDYKGIIKPSSVR